MLMRETLIPQKRSLLTWPAVSQILGAVSETISGTILGCMDLLLPPPYTVVHVILVFLQLLAVGLPVLKLHSPPLP